MDKHNSVRGINMLKNLSQHYTLHRIDIGDDARLSKSGFVFDISVYEIEDVGHLCMMNMKAMFGLTKMETVVPLLNIDWVKVPGKQTLIGELYNTQLEPWPNESQAAFSQISDRDHDLPDYGSGSEHWYDSLLYPCSYHKSGRGIASRLERSANDFM